LNHAKQISLQERSKPQHALCANQHVNITAAERRHIRFQFVY